jgi:hypothetical protein
MVKRKATAILESLKEEPVVQEPTPPPSEPSMTLPSEPSLTLPPPPVEEPPKPVKRVEKRKLNEDNDLMKFQKKLEERESRLEMRLENMIQRKFMEVKNLAKPVMNYKPKQPAPVQRIQPRAEPRYEPRYEPRHVPQYDEYEGYATQEEYEDEEEVVPAIPEKSLLYNKIFGC